MARKITLHLDAVAAIAFVFVAAIGFIGYQRFQYQAVAQESVDRQIKQVQLELQIARLEEIEKKCAARAP